MQNIFPLVQREKERLVALRRDLHRIPETAFTEEKTAAYITAYLQREGFAVETGIARYGVVAHLQTGRPGPTLMIRADMDALPITEETGLPFASTHSGRMHACGHDAHMAMLLVTASLLQRMQEGLRGHVKFIFQPAEEGPGGANPMIEQGVLDNPTVDYALGCHLWPESPQGTIGVRSGPVMAAMDHFDLTVTGKGGHGAMPHHCVDPIDTGAQIVNALQRIVSRHQNPLTPAVVTIGRFNAGSAPNIIPDKARLSGTARTFDETTWMSLKNRIESIVAGVCRSMGADYALQYTRGYPPTINDEAVSDTVRRCARAVVGESRVVVPEPSMGSEDMAFFLQRTKGCFYFIGTGREGGAPVHNPHFDFNEEVMLLGVETHCRAAMALLGRRDS